MMDISKDLAKMTQGEDCSTIVAFLYLKNIGGSKSEQFSTVSESSNTTK